MGARGVRGSHRWFSGARSCFLCSWWPRRVSVCVSRGIRSPCPDGEAAALALGQEALCVPGGREALHPQAQGVDARHFQVWGLIPLPPQPAWGCPILPSECEIRGSEGLSFSPVVYSSEPGLPEPCPRSGAWKRWWWFPRLLLVAQTTRPPAQAPGPMALRSQACLLTWNLKPHIPAGSVPCRPSTHHPLQRTTGCSDHRICFPPSLMMGFQLGCPCLSKPCNLPGSAPALPPPGSPPELCSPHSLHTPRHLHLNVFFHCS